MRPSLTSSTQNHTLDGFRRLAPVQFQRYAFNDTVRTEMPSILRLRPVEFVCAYHSGRADF